MAISYTISEDVALDCGIGRLQRTLLRIAEDQRRQLLAASICEQPDQPRRKVIDDKHHSSSLSATVRPTARRHRLTVVFWLPGSSSRIYRSNE
jgi:hypothetical protein